jgi:tRNA threonylcarbamoyladenosine biosynthesis protein TsaE
MILEYTLEQIPQVAAEILETFSSTKIFTFTGEMGSGKTTLIEEICRSIGTKDTLSSPTYSIINQYDSPAGVIYHMDLFRLKSAEELMDIGFEDIIYSNSYCFIEWPELANDILENFDFVHLQIASISDNTRKIWDYKQ